MEYILYGSQTSPFVRRIRMLLNEVPYEFKELNIFESQDSATLNKVNPLNQVPALQDGNKTIWDSRVIFNYLNSKMKLYQMDWESENTLTAIDGLMTSAMALLMMKRSGINVEDKLMYSERQKDRIESVLNYLHPFIQGHALKTWDFNTMSLFCFLDWAVFRGIITLDKRPECQKLLDQYKTLPAVVRTAIPKV